MNLISFPPSINSIFQFHSHFVPSVSLAKFLFSYFHWCSRIYRILFIFAFLDACTNMLMMCFIWIPVAYLIGLPILGYSLDIGKEHVNLIDEGLQKMIYGGQLDNKELDRYKLDAILYNSEMDLSSLWGMLVKWETFFFFKMRSRG